ncbi:precorrin-6Y methyltransferase [Rhizobium rhizosphaerae]|uniref:Precorrin-6Y methyltransferase n=1 Tax=Xaviernesmea rhizosphaerae TaxID=1672749 RepID=A0A1Q9APP7_9HYPH|nr:precorrin-6y C5,15-methyltransferase (decarboxylating) subunit CbiE [Xaviernesmea rhizosphaerae]OLP57349.1 precorrin-6Y methyltransferase [Xaviernesmea rhizosphaerae]
MDDAETRLVAPWLTLVGLGEDGLAGLGDEAKRRIAMAELVFGGARHLALAGPLIQGTAQAWLSPFSRSVEAVLAARGRRVVVLASGDPFLYGVGATLSAHVDTREMHTIPAPSAFSLAAARLGWPLQEVTCLSLHGRPLDLIRPHLHPGRRILALTSDEKGPAELARLLSATGFGGSRLTVLEALGGARERITRHRAAEFALEDVAALNLCAIKVVAGPDARILPFTPGLPDHLFAHDGQITKQAVRALTLSALGPRHRELLWDVGAGSGSIAIEWMLADPSLRAVAIEADAVRAERIGENARAFGVPGLQIVPGTAPEALGGLARPDAIFIGGGGSVAGVMPAVLDALRPGGRLVANAVTLEMERVLLDHHARLGGALTRIALASAAPVGGMTGWRPAMPITQWVWTKPEQETETIWV